MRSALTSLFDSVASQEQKAKEIAVAKRNRARGMPGAACQSIMDLDSLFDLAEPRQTQTHDRFRAGWILSDGAKECRAAIRALPADRRASLFKHLLALKSYLGWESELELFSRGSIVHGPESDARRFENFCEGAMMVLCETGFPVDAELATRTLDWLAHHCPPRYDLKNVVGRDHAWKALGAVKAIAQAAARGMALPVAARHDALVVFDRSRRQRRNARRIAGEGQYAGAGRESVARYFRLRSAGHVLSTHEPGHAEAGGDVGR